MPSARAEGQSAVAQLCNTFLALWLSNLPDHLLCGPRLRLPFGDRLPWGRDATGRATAAWLPRAAAVQALEVRQHLRRLFCCLHENRCRSDQMPPRTRMTLGCFSVEPLLKSKSWRLHIDDEQQNSCEQPIMMLSMAQPLHIGRLLVAHTKRYPFNTALLTGAPAAWRVVLAALAAAAAAGAPSSAQQPPAAGRAWWPQRPWPLTPAVEKTERSANTMHNAHSTLLLSTSEAPLAFDTCRDPHQCKRSAGKAGRRTTHCHCVSTTS